MTPGRTWPTQDAEQAAAAYRAIQGPAWDRYLRALAGDQVEDGTETDLGGTSERAAHAG